MPFLFGELLLDSTTRETQDPLLYSLCCILFRIVTPHLLTLSPDNINMMQSEKVWAQREPTVSNKTAVVTLVNAQSVLLKGQGSRYNNEPSGPGCSSSPETQTFHQQKPGADKGKDAKREVRETDYLHLKHALAMQMPGFGHANRDH